MPKNIPPPLESSPPEDGNGSIVSSNLINPEAYDEPKPLNASINSASKYFLIFMF